MPSLTRHRLINALLSRSLPRMPTDFIMWSFSTYYNPTHNLILGPHVMRTYNT